MNRCQTRTSFAALLSTHEYRPSSPGWPWNVLLACQAGHGLSAVQVQLSGCEVEQFLRTSENLETQDLNLQSK